MEKHLLFDLTEPGQLDQDKLKNIRTLYDATDWRVVFFSGRVDRRYGRSDRRYGKRWNTENILKALSLPFVLDVVASERGLVKIINDVSELKKICGFAPGDIPVIRFFYDFKRKYKDAYPSIFLNILIAFVLSDGQPNLELPFVEQIEDHELLEGYSFSLCWDKYRSPLQIFTTIDLTEIDTTDQNEMAADEITWETMWTERRKNVKYLYEYRNILEQYERDKRARSEFKRIGEQARIFRALTPEQPAKGIFPYVKLPMDVKASLWNGDKILFRLVNPGWEERHRGDFSFSKEYNQACSILVARERGGKTQILLAQRLDSGYGEGDWALPGGKKKENESVEECVKRELKEETGLDLVKRSTPISRFLRQLPGRSGVETIGVLIKEDEFDGKPERLEPAKLGPWQWRELDELPEPLFDPALQVIHRFGSGKFEHLKWEDIDGVEEFDQGQEEHPENRPEESKKSDKPRQLNLFDQT